DPGRPRGAAAVPARGGRHPGELLRQSPHAVRICHRHAGERVHAGGRGHRARHHRRSRRPDQPDVPGPPGRARRARAPARRRPARSALAGRAFGVSFGLAAGDLLFDLLSLDLVFLALRYQPGFGPLAVAYAAANIASAIPVTPGGLGVVEVTLVAITVSFGAP